MSALTVLLYGGIDRVYLGGWYHGLNGSGNFALLLFILTAGRRSSTGWRSAFKFQPERSVAAASALAEQDAQRAARELASARASQQVDGNIEDGP